MREKIARLRLGAHFGPAGRLGLGAHFGLALALFLAGCAGAPTDPLKIHLVDIAPVRIALFEQRLRIDVRIKNPNNAPVRISGMKLTLALNDVRLLDALGNQTVEVPRLGEALASVAGSTTTDALIRQLLAIDPGKPLRYRLSGRIFFEDVFGSSAPFQSAGEINLPKLLSATQGFGAAPFK